jgi:hypothetical protein
MSIKSNTKSCYPCELWNEVLNLVHITSILDQQNGSLPFKARIVEPSLQNKSNKKKKKKEKNSVRCTAEKKR